MHPVRLVIVFSALIAVVAATLLAFFLSREATAIFPAASPLVATIVIGGFLLVVFATPTTLLAIALLRRAHDVDRLTDAVVDVLAGGEQRRILGREYIEEVDDLARTVDALHTTLVSQRERFAAREAVDERILGAIGEGLVAIDRSRKVVFANRRIAEWFGVSFVSAGRSLVEVLRYEPIIEALDRALEGAESVHRSSIEIHDAVRMIEVRAFPVAGSSEIAAVALLIDVTHVERLESMRRIFLDNFSHEVRTPLAGLRSAYETLDERQLSAEEEEQLHAIVRRQLGRLERLVNDIDQLNRIESGELVLARERVELKHLLSDVAEEFGSRGEPASIRIEGDDAVAVVDPVRAEQIFVNLVDNAIRHGRSREVVLRVEDRPDESLVHVADFGEGIPREEQERIFHRFYRVDRSRSQHVPGSGLGLAITKHLVLLHGGTISVDSEPGKGACFTVAFPKEASG